MGFTYKKMNVLDNFFNYMGLKIRDQQPRKKLANNILLTSFFVPRFYLIFSLLTRNFFWQSGHKP